MLKGNGRRRPSAEMSCTLPTVSRFFSMHMSRILAIQRECALDCLKYWLAGASMKKVADLSFWTSNGVDCSKDAKSFARATSNFGGLLNLICKSRSTFFHSHVHAT